MKILLVKIFKFILSIIYAPLKLLKTKNQIVYLSRQRNEKGIDIELLEKAINNENPSVNQVFRLRMIDDGLKSKISYFFHIVGDMYYLATSKVAIIDTYSIPVSCLKHKEDLKVIQIWHALGALKKFGLQALGTKEGRDEELSKALCMHKNYDYVLSPSAETAKFYMEAFGVSKDKIKICPMPRVDFLTDGNSRTTEFYSKNPSMGDKTLVLYVPTFRDRDGYIANMLKTAFDGLDNYQLIISHHPLSKAKRFDECTQKGDFSSFDLIKIADVIVTDYSACAFESSLLMKPLYFYVPDYDEYMNDRGINVNIKDEFKTAVFDDADELVSAIKQGNYNFDDLFNFRNKYIENTKGNNSQILAKFVLMLMEENK